MSGDLTFSSVGPSGVVHYTKCWECQTMQCPGGMHDWADQVDIDHAAKTGQPSPVGQRCGCCCVDGPVLDPEPDGPDMDGPDMDAPVALFVEPCTQCGELGACGYDAEGRAMVHVTGYIDEDES